MAVWYISTGEWALLAEIVRIEETEVASGKRVGKRVKQGACKVAPAECCNGIGQKENMQMSVMAWANGKRRSTARTCTCGIKCYPVVDRRVRPYNTLCPISLVCCRA